MVRLSGKKSVLIAAHQQIRAAHPIDYLVAIFAHRPTASFASQICCFFAWFCSFHSPVAHKTTKANQKEYVFRIKSVAKFVILYYIYNIAVFATLQILRVVLHQEPIRQRSRLSVYPAFFCGGSYLYMVLFQLTVQYALSDWSLTWFIQTCFSQTCLQFLL